MIKLHPAFIFPFTIQKFPKNFLHLIILERHQILNSLAFEHIQIIFSSI